MEKHGKKQKKANDIEASIPVSEFAEYCSALDKKNYSKAFDIRNRKTPSKSFFSSAYNYEGGNWIKEMYGNLENNNEEFRKLYQGTWIDECTPITKSNFEKLMSIKKPKTKEMKKEIIGYKFKDNDSYVKYYRIYNVMIGENCLFLNYCLKGTYYIKNIESDKCLQFAKKHNLLDELFTPVYKEENKLQSGKWYKTNEDKTLWFINSIDDNGDGNGYGFLFGQWEESNTIALNNKLFDFKEASKEYVESMLIKEAKKRGLKQGVIANSMDEKETFRIKGKLFFNMQRNTLYCKLSDGYAPILENGIWIELKKENNYKTELNNALDKIDKLRKSLEKIDSAIKKIKSND